MPKSNFASPAPRPPERQDSVWQEPLPSKASRRPALRSRGSVRGYFVNPRTRREVVYESLHERDLAYMLVASPHVRSFQEQPNSVIFSDADGRRLRHTFDFLVDLVDDTRRAIAVKPRGRVEKSGIEQTLTLVRSQCGNFADRFDVCTEEHIPRARVHDARLITWALRKRNDDDIAEMMAIVTALRGTTSIASLAASSNDEARGFVSVLCLIADGVLRQVGTKRLSRASSVERTGRS